MDANREHQGAERAAGGMPARGKPGPRTEPGALLAAEAPEPRSGWAAVLELPLLKRSVLLSEIIGPPRGLKGWDQ